MSNKYLTAWKLSDVDKIDATSIIVETYNTDGSNKALLLIAKSFLNKFIPGDGVIVAGRELSSRWGFRYIEKRPTKGGYFFRHNVQSTEFVDAHHFKNYSATVIFPDDEGKVAKEVQDAKEIALAKSVMPDELTVTVL